MTDFYTSSAIRYYETDAETRKAALNHWEKCHIENIKSGRQDLIIYSSQMLAAIHAAEMALNGDASLLRAYFGNCRQE